MTTLVLDQADGSGRTAERRVPSSGRNLRRPLLAAAMVAVIALDARLIGPYIAQATSVLSRPVLVWVAVALAAEIVSLVAAAQVQRRMLGATGLRVRMPTAVGLTYAAYAMSVSLPAGPAVSAGYTFRRLRQLGATTPTAAFTVVSAGVLSTLAYGLVALAGFVVAGGSSGGPVATLVAVVAGVLLVLATRALLTHPQVIDRAGTRVLRILNRVMRRAPDAGTDELRRSTRNLAAIHPGRRDWAIAMAAAVTNWVADLCCLLACCLAVRADNATLGVVLLAYLAGTSVSGVSLVPGGLGVVDTAFILILVGNGMGTADATAAVLLYRALSLGFGLVVGWSAWIAHRRAVRRGAAAADS